MKPLPTGNGDRPFHYGAPRVSEVDGPCWNWPGATHSHGYGVTGGGKNKRYVHRIAYEVARGPIPEGLHIDHLCRNPRCFNPAHLEAVTPMENGRRAATGYYDSTCRKGLHPKSETRTKPNGMRYCAACNRDYCARWRKKVAA